MDAKLYLVNDPMLRKLSCLLRNTFLLDTRFRQRVYGQYAPHQALIQWLEDAQKDGRLCVPFPALTARMFYDMGCLTWPALLSDGVSLQRAEGLREKIVAVFLRAYGGDDAPAAQETNRNEALY
jgi:TetR/AcrR family transcriptional regulator of autoinduction and epiphytic fitness